MRRRVFLRRAAAGVAAPCLVSLLPPGLQAAGRSNVGPADLDVQFRWSPFLALHADLRRYARSGQEPPAHYADGVKAYVHHNRLIPGTTFWLNMERYIARSRDAKMLRSQLALFPSEYREYNLRPAAEAVAATLTELMPVFEAKEGAALKVKREQVVEPMLEETFEPLRTKLLQFVFTSLNAQPIATRRVVMDLVGRYIQLGWDTRKWDGEFFTVVESERFPGLDLLETILLVLGRIIELEDRGNAKGAIFLLRKRQKPLRLPNPATLPRAILYWTAGEAVRRLVNPEHQHVGERLEIYRRAFRPYLPAMEQFWDPYLSGEIGLDEAINGIIARAAEVG